MKHDKLIERLIDDAMGVLAFDWPCDDHNEPTVTWARKKLRERFKATLAGQPHRKPRMSRGR